MIQAGDSQLLSAYLLNHPFTQQSINSYLLLLSQGLILSLQREFRRRLWGRHGLAQPIHPGAPSVMQPLPLTNCARMHNTNAGKKQALTPMSCGKGKPTRDAI